MAQPISLDDIMLWNYVKSSFLARDIVITRFLGKTGNKIVDGFSYLSGIFPVLQ